MLRFASLGSGSKGNATLIEADGTRLLLDCGFSVSELERRLARLDLDPAALSAIVVTHEHADHIGGVARLSRKYRLPVWLTVGTLNAARDRDFHDVECFHAHDVFAIDGIELHPFPVPHDAREPCQFVFSDGQWRLGVLTDTGHITPHIQRSLDGCDALLLECNYDTAMLAAGPYPPALKQRVGGGLGHLANTQAGELLRRMDITQLRHLIGMHVSENNNTTALAHRTLCEALDCQEEWIEVACQVKGFGWRELS
ncbi:MAG: MBL fold metallo-hydrolase [Gammaproteobacteria bacterium]|nr:MBL fold metallo-hydrolase [Gammaproteobacteria bacterium]MDX5375054.1 MBL fold metallo-hydrolase [Gammaproteobacteria bacterium]